MQLPPLEPVDSKTSIGNDTGVHQNSMNFLKSLLGHGTHRNAPYHHKTGGSNEAVRLKDPTSHNGQPWLNHARDNPHQRHLSGSSSFGVQGRGSFQQFGPRDSHKRPRGNGSGQ